MQSTKINVVAVEPVFVSTKEAGKLIGVSDTTVIRLAREGHLGYRKIAPKKFLVTLSSIRKFGERADAEALKTAKSLRGAA